MAIYIHFPESMASLFQRMKKNATGLYRDPLKEQSHEILMHIFWQIFRLRKYYMFPPQFFFQYSLYIRIRNLLKSLSGSEKYNFGSTTLLLREPTLSTCELDS
jgi:hypothetical protein